MSLITFLGNNKEQLLQKHVQQVIAFAGDGKLRDDSETSQEFREFMRHISSSVLAQYADQCLKNGFNESGLALQDIVNEIGRRLEFKVTNGRYRGSSLQPGHDGLWSNHDNYKIVIEVKTTDTYRIDLNVIANYREALARNGSLDKANSSMLIIVGREDTGSLEDQIRGSQYASSMRMISVDALTRMLALREEVEDPDLHKRIHNILIPHDFTKLDPIIEIAFAAVLDVKDEAEVMIESGSSKGNDENKQIKPSSFHAECVRRIEGNLNKTLLKRTKATFSTADEDLRIICMVSKYYERTKEYWYSFHPHHSEILSSAEESYVSFGCGDENNLFLIPYNAFKDWLPHFNTTETPKRSYWHIKIKSKNKGKEFYIAGKAGLKSFDINQYRI